MYRQVFQVPQILHLEPSLGAFKLTVGRHEVNKDSLSGRRPRPHSEGRFRLPTKVRSVGETIKSRSA